MSSLKNGIIKSLEDFRSGSLRDNAMTFFKSLGYQSDRVMEMDNTPEAFLAQFDHRERKLNREKALFDSWQTIDFLFQLTDAEVQQAITQGSFGFDSDVKFNGKNYQSYLFFVLDLKQRHYTRTQLSEISREVNRLFDMPAMILFRLDGELTLTLAIANRRLHKRDTDKDVIQKVILIKDIRATDPHRAHVDILYDLSLEQIVEAHAPKNFAQMHDAWQKTLDIDALNNKFYRELSNWYFWATQHVHFPFDSAEVDKGDLFKDEDKIREHDAKNLIRLLTRLLFVWFIKEKGLVPESLFNPKKLKKETLKDFDEKSSDTCFYKAILQNLFFAALNQTHGNREFRKEGRQHRNVTTLMRYESYFQDPKTFLELVDSVVPFMNGGLFECLDKVHPDKKGPQGGDVILYEDGFSDCKDNVLKVPDFLFFAEIDTIDLSDVYGDKKRIKETVRGLFPILESYKFTIVENTPIEEEIALDPELLGKVFENLLASYNPETKTTARKQTGSFYTPRTIVDYMVDESLKAYLKKKLCEACPEVSAGDAEEGLDILFAYTEKEHAFTDAEKHALIEAIDNCKILDPACGSGAFPMGILHKLEFVLSKLDPQNRLWRDRQIEKVNATIAAAEQIDDAAIRENTVKELKVQKRDIEEAFANNELGYGRKLYLIENCIYGVDIQSIATQVSKLRFFISLIVDQKVNAKKSNFGIRPLPNLETKFATADTLIQVEKPTDQGELFENPKIQDLEKELKQVRHNLFSAKTPKTKNKYRQRDKELRKQISVELQAEGWSNASARQLAHWDPYDQNAASPFFDPEWMFDLKGFDVVIGNPPYVQIQKFAKAQKDKWVAQKYQTYVATADIYCLFYERGAQLLSEGGHLCYITSNNWMRANYGKKLRNYLTTQVNPLAVLDFGMGLNFNAAAALTNILLFSKESNTESTMCCYASDAKGAMEMPEVYCKANSVCMPDLGGDSWIVISPEHYRIKKTAEAKGIPLEQWDLQINYGIKTGFNDAFYLTQEERDELIAKEPQAEEILVPLLRGRYVERYATSWDQTWMIGTFPSLSLDIEKYPHVKKHLTAFLPKLNQTGESFVNKEGKKEKTRKKTQGEWFETQDSIAYNAEFRKPKIIYPNMTKFLPFYYDEQDHFYGNQKCFIITSETESLPYLTAVLNSSLFKYCFRDNFPELLGNTYELSKVFFAKIPIRKPKNTEAEVFESLVAMMQLAKRKGNDVPAAFLEELIDACVLELYFPEEAATKDLQFMDKVSDLFGGTGFAPSVCDIENFVATANDPKHPIRNQLIRLTSHSSDLFAVIKREGAES